MLVRNPNSNFNHDLQRFAMSPHSLDPPLPLEVLLLFNVPHADLQNDSVLGENQETTTVLQMFNNTHLISRLVFVSDPISMFFSLVFQHVVFGVFLALKINQNAKTETSRGPSSVFFYFCELER